jgi:hypothetical protein
MIARRRVITRPPRVDVHGRVRDDFVVIGGPEYLDMPRRMLL